MTPCERYDDDIKTGALAADAAQARAIARLQHLYEQLLATPGPTPLRVRRLIPGLRRRATAPIRGLYLWGGVGRGKTRLMDLFFHALPLAQKRRSHFHRFMGEIHGELESLKGQPDPLRLLAGRIAASVRVLCLDEFQVWDIGDAMILGRLLNALFERGVTLIATSNSAPDGLYPNGLQRGLFLPAIERIKAHTETLELDSETDYRLRALERAEIYHTPLNGDTDRRLAEAFRRVAPEPGVADTCLRFNGRDLQVRRHADSIAWIDFSALCDGPRSRADYLEVARCYHTLLISGVPRMGDGQNDQAKRFIHLIDVLYDHNVTLVLSAAAAADDLYDGEVLAFEFRRTASRLREMQSRDWLERPHLG